MTKIGTTFVLVHGQVLTGLKKSLFEKIALANQLANAKKVLDNANKAVEDEKTSFTFDAETFVKKLTRLIELI